jgi:hypothetical protein
MIVPEKSFFGMSRFNYWDYFVWDLVSDHIEIKLPSYHALTLNKVQNEGLL